ncbi:HAD family hydrolase [Agromyces sp. M3QZ16-3]|uniref:HAD family hydrolase n=1 Tax=Agromyces sp. M3QZ16-3 TaxID=3447585 RepID=UPI003F68C749
MPSTIPAPIALSPRVVVFDYGEVISRSPSDADRAALVERAGIAHEGAEAFWRAYWAHRDELDRGTLAISDYWARVADDLGIEWSEVDRHELWAIDHRGWLSVDPATLAVLHALRDGGTRLALLSNAGADFGGWLRHGSFAPLFEAVFVSGELRMVKPEAEIFAHVMRELGITPDQLLFVDNKPVNVDGAIAVGGAGHVFTDASALESWLRELAE